MAKRFKQFLSSLSASTRSLKTALAVYFIPISIVPTVFLSIYATRVFEESTKETFVRRAASERDAIVAEIETLEGDLLSQAKAYATSDSLLGAMRGRRGSDIGEALSSFRSNVSVRVFSPDGAYLAGRAAPDAGSRVPYLSKEGLRRVRSRGETVERYFAADGTGFITMVRVLVKDGKHFYGVLEEEYHFGSRDLADMKNRRQVDVVFLSRDFNSIAASFALPADALKSFSSIAFAPNHQGLKDPIFVRLGDSRYAAFLYDLPAPFGKAKKWGFVAVFLSMSAADATILKLKAAMVYLTALLVLVVALLIFIFSNRLVKPIEALVIAMKRVRTGRVEQIPSLDSTYEIEYLVHSFNEMARNVSAAKRALELKLEELGRANLEIKNTQSTLVQSAKMISLGQIVAGVAHELNNPIAFIYSNMHHLSDYVGKIRELVETYRSLQERLSPEDRLTVANLERAIEIDFILKDMEDLTRSCVEGARRTKDIVLGLRTFSRMDESTFKPSDLHEGLRNTVRLLVTEFKDRITIHEELGNLPLVECNLSQMNQVFMNLLSNAAHAIEGKGDVWIRTRVEAGASAGDRVAIEIEDSGVGIRPELVEKIFDPFFTTKKVGQGTGLGLSIAYGLVQKHHGDIRVESVVGRGTKFTVRLPVRQPVAQAG